MRTVDRLVPWAVGILVVSVSIGAVFVAVQQDDRSSADDVPQAIVSQLVTDAGVQIPGTTAAPRVDLASSRMPFYVIYTRTGRPVAGDGYLEGTRARIPSGVLAQTLATGADHVTWEPRTGLRFALTTARHGDTVIAAGQSLSAPEQRTGRIGLLLLLAWLVAVFALLAGAALHAIAGRRTDE